MNEDLLARTAGGGRVDRTPEGYELAIPAGESRHYRLAQLDDYTKLSRRAFPYRPALRLSLRARASAADLPGTWGFGLWNDPFGLSIGFGGNALRLPAPPNAIWFFHASEENYLSFDDHPGNGFLAQAFRSALFPIGRLAQVGLTLPFSGVKARALLGEVVEEDSLRLSVDVTAWHTYRLEWSPARSAFRVDEGLCLETAVSPRPPLGLVIWIDNQYAAFSPQGQIGSGVLENTEPAWLEIERLELD